ncbi:hypothetical protein [Streptomonospora arabica]|uniref:Uncharacterized protein n=1 Tax=Streptomonospora arabica TaxID=412417 RepID=A0ABV9SSQ0_9ACTN
MTTITSAAHPDSLTLPWSPIVADATLYYRFDATEHARRQQTAAAPLTVAALETLMSLPLDMGVSLASLTASERARVHQLPAGAATIADGHVTRRAVRPLVVDLAAVSGPPRKALEQASRFAPFCARLAVLARPARHMCDYLNEAAFWGVGVAVAGELVLEPSPWRPQRHTVAGWRFVEQVYERATG